MQETSVLLSLAAVFAVALVSPGPDVALVVRTAMHEGRRAGLLSALGLACGILVHGMLVLTGVALLVSRSPMLFDLLQLIGASYLGWLGIGAVRAWFRRGQGGGSFEGALSPSALGPWLRGLATNLFNPKALVFFLAMLSGLIPADMSFAGKVGAAAILFGMGLAWFSGLGLALTRGSNQQLLLRAAPAIDLACGLVFLLVALGLAGRLLAPGLWQ
ncbi:LysE family transporter [Pseudomonas sp. JS3066]|jgi:threonine/homoserine/homoserine lactone efflux protein|uniref:LysE family translocator n=1 Tax=unclassified Pseudomonas TaxID=196821 RepID=UPI00129ED756|nr:MULTISPECIES: LysE family transporter [unclassified Pseudomonas]MDH4652849.1 LysE family translocator [Pseudomonas sp. BN606]MRK23236.1 LysE family translocator [Pseudomonas sp. JG-B]WVK95203.1 LysE family transporter [Pseudomonas sp. JS3066]